MRTIMLIGFCLMLTTAASAQTNCRTFGNLTHCDGPNGYTSDSRRDGDLTQTRENGPNGQQRISNCRTFGNQTRCD